MSEYDQKYVLTSTPDGKLVGAVVCAEVEQAPSEAADDDEDVHLSCP